MNDDNIRILAINPGSTSTKIAVYQNARAIFLKTIKHSTPELEKFEKITDQYEYRKNMIYRELEEAEIRLHLIRAVVGRGGLVKPIASGVYEVNESMKRDLCNSPLGEHASNLGGLIADDFAKTLPNAKAFIADPVVVDEMEPLARYSGHPDFDRVSIFHALNQKAVARTHAKSIMQKYEDLNLIVVHLGGGISIGAHKKGNVIDVNQALDGDGPFSPERSGSLPVGALVKGAFSGKYTLAQMKKMIKGNGGMAAYLGTNDAYEAELKAADGDEKAREVFEAMAYQVAKEVGGMYTVLKGEVDGILITGGIANSKWFVNLIIQRVYKIAPVHVYPGEDEMQALATNGLLVLKGEIELKEYV
ncbi:MAG: butyrate kinase [Bacteroidales bacterium]|nr:butyrate kinase [Bacteroidales bacterium]MCF8334132.1 butyrate kinase [Bacteroidales bacterium]